MNKDLIFKLLQQALVMFLEKEQRNIELNVHEDGLSSKLSSYLKLCLMQYDKDQKTHYFDDYDVDIQVNKTEGGDPKRYGESGKIMRCDLMIHSKGLNPDQENLLYIEMKKNNNSQQVEKDKQKLCELVGPVPPYVTDDRLKKMYETVLGVFLELDLNTRHFHGIKYWYEYENEKVQSEEFTV